MRREEPTTNCGASIRTSDAVGAARERLYHARPFAVIEPVALAMRMRAT
jgi:hypothetical protein